MLWNVDEPQHRMLMFYSMALGFLAVFKGYSRIRLYQLDRVVEVARLGFCYAGSSSLQQRLFLLYLVTIPFRRWSTRAADTWNISGEPCSGSALNQRDFVFGDPANNPAIRCDCSFNDATVCRITILRVVGLDKQGEITKELLDLPFLTVLKIDQNFFSGHLPAFIGNMSRLGTLSISYNSFSGPIPKELGNLKDLSVLSMSNNNFSGALPPELGSLANLEELYINSCGFSGEIPSTFANLERLQIVWASDNAFTGKIPDFVGNNWTKLTSLRYQGNSFEGPIPSSFAKLTSLTSLRIGDIYNGSSSLDFVRNLTNLTDLDLSFNNLTGTIPIALFTMNSLQDLFLGNNSLTGDIPKIKTDTLQTMNLVGNYLTLNSLDVRRLPGFECLQRSFPCNRNATQYASFSIKCGGPTMVCNGMMFEADNRPLGGATYDITSSRNWAVGNVGLFADRQIQQYVHNTIEQVTSTNDPELFKTSRLSPGSLRYYGLGLENGLYTVNLFFAETGFPDPTSHSWKSKARHVFDVYIQGTRELRDFDIAKEAGGIERAIIKNFTANVLANHLEIHLFWAGKGTCCTPEEGYYGPSILAIRVVPSFIPPVGGIPPKEKNWTALIVGITVSVVVLPLILIFAITCIKRKGEDDGEDVYLKDPISPFNRKGESLLGKVTNFIALTYSLLTAIFVSTVLLGISNKSNTFSYSELKAATGDFSPSNKLGEGGFGAVYKDVTTCILIGQPASTSA
ncbi:hypothetical protein V6N12_029560 [Hibiscus sabdariffa]|uniref:non-specific serine/threonine protein kinase n=1 Tax=Hibiscus sabdariffa TaxID=183260 RepID=A0ABR2CWH8_9ROSI